MIVIILFFVGMVFFWSIKSDHIPSSSKKMDMKKNQKHTTVPSSEKLEPFQIKQALVGLEMKQTDEKILQYLHFFSQVFPVRAVAFEHLLPPYVLFSHLLDQDAQLAEHQQQQRAQLLGQMTEKIERNFKKQSPMTITHEVRKGDPLEGLLKSAKDIEADLVLVGQKMQEGGHGILTRKLVSLLNTKAMIIPQGTRLSLKKILVPVDFSENSEKALETAIRIKQQMNEKPEIICLHIFDMPEFATREAFRELVREDKEQAMADFIVPYISEGYGPFDTVLLEKEFPTRTARYILEYALDQQADLLILGAKGLSLVESMMVGSVTERLLSINDHIPTLIVK